MLLLLMVAQSVTGSSSSGGSDGSRLINHGDAMHVLVASFDRSNPDLVLWCHLIVVRTLLVSVALVETEREVR